jgi:drug/metabolite transporter (DMT)-like permease
MEYLYILIADLLLAVIFTCNKVYQRRVGDGIKTGVAASAVMGTVSFIIFFAASGFKLEITALSSILAFTMALSVSSYSILAYKVLKTGKVAIYVMFLMAGGMALPYVWGLIFGGESFSILRTIGLVIILAAVVLINVDKTKPSKMQIILCIIIFFLNGFSSISSKTHQDPGTILSSLGINATYETVDTVSFVALVSIFKILISVIAYGILSLSFKKKNEAFLPYEKGNALIPMLIISGAAVADGISYYFQLLGASKLDAGVLYPLVSGGSIVLTAVAAFLAFREKPSKTALVGIVICIAGMCLFI